MGPRLGLLNADGCPALVCLPVSVSMAQVSYCALFLCRAHAYLLSVASSAVTHAQLTWLLPAWPMSAPVADSSLL